MDLIPQNPPPPPTDSEQELTDEALWQALGRGDVVAFGQLYDRHSSLVYGIAIKLLDQTEAEDLTQDIFLKLFSDSGYDPSRGSLRTYLVVLTRSRAIDRLRHRQVKARSLERLQRRTPTSSADLDIDTLFTGEQSAKVKAALGALSESQREILRLAYYEGLTQTAIAQRLNTPLGTVKTRARRGLMKLREMLRDYWN